MPVQAAKPAVSRDSFLDALNSEILEGGEILDEWVRQIHARGGIESLFALETWLRGLRSFFNLEHLPLNESGTGGLLNRSFASEIRIVRKALQVCETFACSVLNADAGGEIDNTLDVRVRRGAVEDSSAGAAMQSTPSESVCHLLEFLNDFRITIDSLKSVSLQLFMSLGRSFNRELTICRYVDMLISRRFRPQYDAVDNRSLTTALRRIPAEPIRRNTALVFLYLFRFLRYLQLIQADLNRDCPLKQSLVIYSLLHEETAALAELLKTRLLRYNETGEALRNAAEFTAYSIKLESQRVQTRELAEVSREADPGIVYSRIENSHGLLRNCFQSCILTLIQSVDKSLVHSVLFPPRTGQLAAAEKLRQDLWELRRWLMDVLGSKEPLDSNRIIERIGVFKEASLRSLMYRDWAEFESFADALAVSSSYGEIRTHLRKFVSHLETLIQEVSKRSVFQEAQPKE